MVRGHVLLKACNGTAAQTCHPPARKGKSVPACGGVLLGGGAISRGRDLLKGACSGRGDKASCASVIYIHWPCCSLSHSTGLRPGQGPQAAILCADLNARHVGRPAKHFLKLQLGPFQIFASTSKTVPCFENTNISFFFWLRIVSFSFTCSLSQIV